MVNKPISQRILDVLRLNELKSGTVLTQGKVYQMIKESKINFDDVKTNKSRPNKESTILNHIRAVFQNPIFSKQLIDKSKELTDLDKNIKYQYILNTDLKSEDIK
ncbi:hypothetical protein [Paramaledivibacter caminithermalis]|jgi:hypothetical protein|uniref:Uncharacterized protein n=1 Tax=Paramaledivibacter caminithermalis (strain DSM 15212 / CIP 107654 / DViRD3) TaxID=1121301 RepID=A0A1M6NAI2_PARC5|nr:hypothetical protein [Paramaledivibacter caminithermalis]SHJ92664.1 hypothetical protein SAMN02745912_01631 [Paramaledivibacter caminithermalis DSM 15212]